MTSPVVISAKIDYILVDYIVALHACGLLTLDEAKALLEELAAPSKEPEPEPELHW